MYNISALVTEERTVRAAVSMFPVAVSMGGSGLTATRFVLAQVPGTDANPEWVACVWASNPRGGEPILHIAEKVRKVGAFSAQLITLALENDQVMTVSPSGGCGCGSRLKTWQPWGPSARVIQVPRPSAGA